ncbi:MAG: penicillin-binding protein 2 [Lactobacillus sp.]|nr:penicillin-binding protein 2 [Lactobacillus sp.]
MKFLRKASGQNKKKRSQIPFRLNFLFLIVFFLFAALIGQLVYLQIINGNQFESEATSSNNQTETKNVQRGLIYDSSGKLLVANNTTRAITYTKPLSVTSSEMYTVATNLAKYITVDTDTLTTANKIAYYLANPTNTKKVNAHIKNAESLSVSKLTKLQNKYVKEHGLVKNFTTDQKEAAYIYNKMSGAYALSTVYIKTSDVTDTEMAEVGEHISTLAGVKVGTSSSRSYPNGESVKSVIGTVTTEKQGLPSDKINTLLAQGYSRNDSVGSSYIESQYENVLKGTKQIINVITRNNKVVKEVTQYGGSDGDSIQLTINAEFQSQVQQIVQDAVSNAASSNPYIPGGYAVVMNPKNGAIYALAGVSRDVSTGEITENALGTINQTFVMGSVVKGAMVMGALTDGVITPTNNTLLEEPIKLAGTATKASWFNKTGSANMNLTASEALEVSSNTYMMKLAMLEGGFTYTSGAALNLPTSIFSKLRQNFKQYGLGVKTGIDIPGESSGYEGTADQSHIGNALDLSFGNYDAYTTIQLAQYASTIANGGYRLQPHILKSIRATNKDGSLGAVKYEFQPNVLNVVSGTKAQWNVVKTGMWLVVHGTNQYKTGGSMESITPQISAKTGTAQTYYNNIETETLSAISYAPATDPQVVVVVAFPNITDTSSKINTEVVKQIYEAYWKTVQSSDGYS